MDQDPPVADPQPEPCVFGGPRYLPDGHLPSVTSVLFVHNPTWSELTGGMALEYLRSIS